MVKTHEINLNTKLWNFFQEHDFRMTQIRSITTNDGFKDGYVMLNVTKL